MSEQDAGDVTPFDPLTEQVHGSWDAAQETYTAGGQSDYMIATVVLVAVAALAVLVFCGLSLFTLGRRADPARSAVSWVKISFVLLTLGIWCSLATYSIVLYIIENDPINYEEHYAALLEASAHLELLWEFFDHWARGSILVMLVYLGTGIHRVSRGSSAFWHRFVRWGTLAMAFVIFATSAAYYGFQVNNLVNRYSGTWPENEGELIDDWETADKLVSATSILIWITSVGQVGLSIIIWMLASGMRSTAILYVLANLLNFVGTTWVMVFHIRYRLMDNAQPAYVGILHAVLSMWAYVGALAIAWFLLVRKGGGIWTTGSYGTPKTQPDAVRY